LEGFRGPLGSLGITCDAWKVCWLPKSGIWKASAVCTVWHMQNHIMCLMIINAQEYDNDAENLIHGLAYNCSDEDLDLGNCSSYAALVHRFMR